MDEILVETGWTKEEMVKRTGVARSTLTAYQLGTRRPSAGTLRRIADALEKLGTRATDEAKRLRQEAREREREKTNGRKK